jgi:hypothetical protein
MGAVSQPEDWTEKLQCALPEMSEKVQAKLPGNRRFLRQIQPAMGPKKHPGFSRK